MAFNAFKDNLTESQISDELEKLTSVKSQQGFLYFLQNYTYVEHPSGYKFLKDNIFNWQIEAAPQFLSSRYVIAKKRRQVGYSTIVGAYCLWRALLFDSQIINVVSIKLKDSTTFLRRTKFIYNHLPRWMKQRRIEDAKTIMAFEHNNSSISSLPLTDDPARGETLALLVLDEFAAMRNAPEVLAAGVPSLAAGSQIPWTNNSLPSQLFIISTYPADPVDNEYVRLLNIARENPKDSGYVVVDVDPSDIPYYQNEAWKKEQLDLLGHKRYAVEIEGDEPLDSENALLPSNVIQSLHDQPPIRIDFLLPTDVDDEGYYKDLNVFSIAEDNFDASINYIKGLWIWENPDPKAEYCITCDVAKGVGGSASAFVVFNLHTMEQAAEFENDKIDIEAYKKVIEIVAKYYNNAKLSVENNGLGIGVVAYFSETINYDNFYYHRMSKKRYEAGFPMGVNTRGPAIVHMQSFLTSGEITIKSLRLINQLRNFGYTKNGKIKGLGSGRDDIVMALCQICYLLNIGWAVSLKQYRDERPLGIISSNQFDDIHTLEEEKVEAERKRKESKVFKYWEDQGFDIDNLDEQTKAAIEIIRASGMAISREEIEAILSGKYHL